MLQRLKHILLALFRVIDIVLCWMWLAPLYLFNLADKPTGRQLISSYVGKASYNGHRWGRFMEKVIDKLALWVGDGPDHCYRAYIFYLPLEEENENSK